MDYKSMIGKTYKIRNKLSGIEYPPRELDSIIIDKNGIKAVFEEEHYDLEYNFKSFDFIQVKGGIEGE